jgi:hypothetical protein
MNIYFLSYIPTVYTAKTRYNDLGYSGVLRSQRYFFGPKYFCRASNDILFIANIVSIYGPKVQIYKRYRYIYTDLYLLMPTYAYYMV